MKQFISSWNRKDIEGIMYSIRGNSNKILMNQIASYITNYKHISSDDSLFVFRVLGIFLDNAKLYGYVFETFTLNCFISWKGILKFLEYNKPYQYINKIDEYGFSPLLDCARYGNCSILNGNISLKHKFILLFCFGIHRIRNLKIP